MAGSNGRFTATEKKIIDVLSDGLPHRREELHACLPDELGDRINLNLHISNIRKKIVGRGEDIVCQLRNRRIHYRHVRMLHSPARD